MQLQRVGENVARQTSGWERFSSSERAGTLLVTRFLQHYVGPISQMLPRQKAATIFHVPGIQHGFSRTWCWEGWAGIAAGVVTTKARQRSDRPSYATAWRQAPPKTQALRSTHSVVTA